MRRGKTTKNLLPRHPQKWCGCCRVIRAAGVTQSGFITSSNQFDAPVDWSPKIHRNFHLDVWCEKTRMAWLHADVEKSFIIRLSL